MTRSSQLGAALFLVLAVAACGSGDGPTGPSYPTVTGTYNGNWSMELEVQSTGASARALCPGSITISSENQGQISGSYIMQAAGDCDSSDSGNVSGTVRTDGGVSLGLSSPGGNPNEFGDLTGCTVTSGDSQMTGTITQGRLDVDASFFADCPDSSGQYYSIRVTLGFSG